MAGNKNSGRRYDSGFADWTPPAKPKLPKAWGRKSAYSSRFVLPTDELAWSQGYRYSQAHADHFCEFCRNNLRWFQGRWAGEPVEFDGWQRIHIINPLFGWVHRYTGLRRFRQSYIELCKKNGKSTLAASIVAYFLFGDGERAPECYSAATTAQQAKVVHEMATSMMEASPTLGRCITVNRTTGAVRAPKLDASYRVLANVTRGQQGLNASLLVLDELHEWNGREHWNALRYATRAREQSLAFSITNSGDDMTTVCYEQHQKAQRVLDGSELDVSFLPFILTVDEQAALDEIEAVGSGSTDIPIAASVNPALGTILRKEDLLADIRSASHNPSEVSNLLRLTYGVWRAAASDDPWLSKYWGDCREDFTEADCEGYPCLAGLDVASVKDFCALSLLFQLEEDHYRVLPYYWISQARIDELKRFIPADQWASDGHIRVNRGRSTDHRRMRDDIIALQRRFGFSMLLYDPKMADTLTADISAETGCERVEFIQTNINFHEPCERLERMVAERELRHNGHPVLAYQASNVTLARSRAEHVRPVRPGAEGDIRTIDGITALVMAVSQADKSNAKPQRNFYESNALELI